MGKLIAVINFLFKKINFLYYSLTQHIDKIRLGADLIIKRAPR